ncbi:protein dopey-1 homolog isoform X2 [Harmonia axyridis]|uniref:protein dopey-1 homolog isoform X2 n=1 Tax=Harmonia axyridis TaxID=115357 RepID=UPI001E279BBF|nr:protein dopey-1 homolog isoform X2 [Harmonia axyridis]
MTTITMEEYELMKESKYRMYVAAVDKALKNFEYTSEWADLISALGKLNKVLSTYLKYPVIPRRIKISKRLAQCMHPALPSGVHLKALETYDIIFRTMGTSRLAQELFIYSAGLFPLLGHAAMNIRPQLLKIYENHFVPLGERMRPALSGFLSGVLPGIESGSDHFERTNDLLEKVCDGVGASYFYTCMWQCVANNSPVRLSAISFVLAHYSKKMPMEDQLYLMGHDIDLMVCGLCAAVQDSSVLVQRSALDLLMVCFPMNNKQLLYADMVRLVTAALSTILRRDMSLNRRLYSWLLGTESHSVPASASDREIDLTDTTNTSVAYNLLNDAIRVILTNSSSKPQIDIKPYRLLTSLFDKPQIGPVILDSILYDVFRALYLSCLNLQKSKNGSARCVSFNGDLNSLNITDDRLVNKQFISKNCQELVKNANLLFNTLQSYYIWSYVEKLFKQCVTNIKNYKNRDKCQVNEIGSGVPHILETCILTEFLLDIIPIESYGESNANIQPNLFNNIIIIMKENLDSLNSIEIIESLNLCNKILSKIQPVTVTTTDKVTVAIGDEAVVEIDKKSDSSVNIESSQDEGDQPVKSLEKSKSDSRLNENMNNSELLTIEETRERSNSNQMPKKKEKFSPKIDKKSKNKKSKSSSKLYDMKKEDLCESGDENSETQDSIREKEEEEKKEPPPPPLKVATVENKSFLKCLEEYKKFYVVFVEVKVLPDVNIHKFFKSMVCDKNERIKKLQKLLEDCLSTHTEFEPIIVRDILSRCSFSNSLATTPDYPNSEYEKATSIACNILLEFSAFPNLTSHSISGEKTLPSWLEALIAASCCRNSSKEIQLSAMNAMLEIFSLAKAQNPSKNDESSNNVIITGILNREHVNYIEENTIVIEEMSQILWQFLGQTDNQNHTILCVTLLYQIHNIFDDKLFVERIIGKYLSSENLTLEYIKRFFLVWHLGRDLNIKLPLNKPNIRNFDRSLLKILDNLQNYEKLNLKLLAESFLSHSLLHNDIPRILNPLLTKLLSPNTARVAIRHVNIQDSDCQSEINVQDNVKVEHNQPKIVYAVSNVNGNIMYHVTTDGPSPKQQKSKWFMFSKNNKKFQPSVVNVTTSVTEDLSNVVTKKNKDFRVQQVSPKFDKNGKGNVKLFINPLSSKEIYPTGLNGSYSKLDPHKSMNSSSESLTSSNDCTSHDSPIKSFPNEKEPTTMDSGYESVVKSKTQPDIIGMLSNGPSKKILEKIEPIEDGVKDKFVDPKLPKSRSFDEKSASMENASEQGNSLVHSWSYCLSDSENLHAELELSTSAEDFFKTSDKTVIAEIMLDLLDRVCERIDGDSEITDSSSTTTNRHSDTEIRPKIHHSSKNFVLYPIHSHICLYYEVFDSSQVFYALQTLKNCILSNPQLFIKCLATSGLKNLQNNEVLYLLARHRKSILGYHFTGDLNQEYVNFYRGYMFLDVIISICLNYARTFYPCLDDVHLTNEEMNMNFKIQLESLEILDVIVKNLIAIVKDNTKGFSSYIADMLVKCKLQKILLHCLLTSVRTFDEDMTFAEEVLMFNNFLLFDSNQNVGEHIEAFQIQLLRLIQSLIVLEFNVFPSSKPSGPALEQIATAVVTELNYTPTMLTPYQQIFLSAIMSALRQHNMKNLQEKWLNMVTSCLPYFGENLKQISISVIHQICNNIEDIASSYRNWQTSGELCPDYAVTQLESLTILCHYSLLDSSQTVNQKNVPESGSNPVSHPSEIFNNLFNAFFSPSATDGFPSVKPNADHYQNARKTILSHMPRIISSVAKLWQTIVSLEGDFNSVYGNLKIVKQQLLEFLSPIAVHHSCSFLAAIAVAWFERRNVFSNVKTVLPEPNAGQNNLVYLISAIRVIPLDNLVQTVTAVIKNPPTTEGLSSDICLDVSVLELFYCYMRNASTSQLLEAWTSLLTLIREGCALSPSAQFLLAALLHELMIKCCPLEDRKDQKDLQDVTSKLIESVAQICGSCLEQTTWLRRNLAVKEQDEDHSPDVSIINSGATENMIGSSHSVQAQLLLAEILSPILDICFGSSEKEKVNTILTSLMYNIVPYLKTHTVRNMPSYLACSKLLASLSSYQYTRKAWKKDVFDLLFDNAFFQVDHSCLKYWKVIVDNLMTHDNITFRDLMNRVSMPQSGSLSLFTSREQEYEQKAQLLKRLAYVIFCSEIDQYAKYMSDIQEQLTTSLRLPSPNIQAQVFLCFRVILIRMSPLHVTSLWPIIISEMLQVFLQIEQELSTDTEEFSSHIKLLSSLDASWAINSSNGLHALGHPHWLRLQLSTAKLLDLTLLLPATTLPQFQMYRWAFVGDDLDRIQNSNAVSFTPHVVRIAEQMDKKYNATDQLAMRRNELLLTMNSISQLQDLHGFFKTLSLCSDRHRTDCVRTYSSDTPLADRQTDKKLDVILEKIDKVVETDFLDKIPR